MALPTAPSGCLLACRLSLSSRRKAAPLAVPDPEIIVVCLCAGWCGVCRDYGPVFAQVAARLPHMRFVWVDIEDDADTVDPIEVDNFPTLLIAGAGEPRFFGPLTPQPATLERVVRESAGHRDPALAQRADLRALVARLAAR